MPGSHDKLCPLTGSPDGSVCQCALIEKVRVDAGWDVARVSSAGKVDGRSVVFHDEAIRAVREPFSQR